jgi:hypothetical protein
MREISLFYADADEQEKLLEIHGERYFSGVPQVASKSEEIRDFMVADAK